MLKKLAFLLVISILLIPIITNAESIEEEVRFLDDPENIEYETTIDNSFINSLNNSNMNYSINTFCPHGCVIDGGSSYSNPMRVNTNVVDVKGVPLEYSIVNGELVIYKRDGYHYYVQSANHGWFNAVTGNITRSAANIVGTYLTYKAVSTVPYLKKVFDAESNQPFRIYQSLTAASSYMVQERIPVWGSIVSTPVPSAGTKETVIYISETGRDYTWHHRIRFVISPNGSLEIRTWYVN